MQRATPARWPLMASGQLRPATEGSGFACCAWELAVKGEGRQGLLPVPRGLLGGLGGNSPSCLEATLPFLWWPFKTLPKRLITELSHQRKLHFCALKTKLSFSLGVIYGL